MTTGRTGAAAARCTRAAIARYNPPTALGKEYRQHARGVLALAFLTPDGCISVAHRAQCVESRFTVKANVFVDRHVTSLLS